MFALAAAGEAHAERGDVSPSTKLSSCTPLGGSDTGKGCGWGLPLFLLGFALPLWGFPQWGRRGVGELPVPQVPAGVKCYGGEVGEQEQDGERLPRLGFSRTVRVTE